jgi:hypothetical protein
MSSDNPDISYIGIYSDADRIQQRVPQIDLGFTPQVLTYQKYVDKLVDRTIRSTLGIYDKNGFYISLPLTGDFDVVDIQKMVVSFGEDDEIDMAADNLVIALFRKDQSENEEKLKIAEDDLILAIRTKFGEASSIDQDFTTDYLIQTKFLWEDGTPMELEDGSGVWLVMDQTNVSGPTINNRVIFVPAPA